MALILFSGIKWNHCSHLWLLIGIIQWAFTKYWVSSIYIFKMSSGNSIMQLELKTSGLVSGKK